MLSGFSLFDLLGRDGIDGDCVAFVMQESFRDQYNDQCQNESDQGSYCDTGSVCLTAKRISYSVELSVNGKIKEELFAFGRILYTCDAYTDKNKEDRQESGLRGYDGIVDNRYQKSD